MCNLSVKVSAFEFHRLFHQDTVIGICKLSTNIMDDSMVIPQKSENRASVVVPWQPIWAPGQALVAPLLIQFAADVPGVAADDGSSVWAPAP